MTSKEIDYKKHFEQNMLDGDKVQEGQMLASTEVLDYILALIQQAERNSIEKFLIWYQGEVDVDVQTGKTDIDYFYEEKEQPNG